MAKKNNTPPEKTLELWQVRDLASALSGDTLPSAYEVDHTVATVRQVLVGGRTPVLCGERGVGKTAVIYQLLKEHVAGQAVAAIGGRAPIQLSFQQRLCAMDEWGQIRPECRKLIAALVALKDDIFPFISDLHQALAFGLAPQLSELAFRFGPCVAEGETRAIEDLFEYNPGLEEHYTIVRVDEPASSTVELMLDKWNAERTEAGKPAFTKPALLECLSLTDRFLARSRFPRKAFDLANQVASLETKASEIDSEAVIERFCATHRIPRKLVDPKIRLDLHELSDSFNQRILGQSEAVGSVVQTIARLKAGLSDGKRPLAAFLFVGPTGVGKTHIAQLLAEYLFGSRDRLIRVNMADLWQNWADQILFGDPMEDRRRQRQGTLTLRLQGHAFGVLLLDEFEKAHSRVHDRFLQLMDEGRFINGAGEAISCRSLIIVATSNAGAELYRGQHLGFSVAGSLQEEVRRKLGDIFRFEFLNRFDHIVQFNPLSRVDIRTIARRELIALEHRIGLKQRGYKLEFDEAIIDWLVVHGFDANYGARFLKRAIERDVAGALAETIVADRPADGACLSLTCKANRVVAFVEHEPKTGAIRQQVVLPVGTEDTRQDLAPEALVREGLRIQTEAEALLTALEADRAEVSRILEEMSEQGFWESKQGDSAALQRYRSLEVRVKTNGRLARPIVALAELTGRAPRSERETKALARAVERAAASLRDWETRAAEESADSLWLVLSLPSPSGKGSSWLADLVQAELRWCSRLKLNAAPIAYAVTDTIITHTVIEVEGPGAAHYLAMEVGLHRLARSQGHDLKLWIDLVPASETVTDRKLRQIKQRRGEFGLHPAWKGRIEDVERGQVLEFVAANETVLRDFLGDYEPVWRQRRTELPTARHYGMDGRGAVDPRTGGVVPRYKDALKGRFDLLLEAWRRREQQPGNDSDPES